jgi:hypothetical protein
MVVNLFLVYNKKSLIFIAVGKKRVPLLKKGKHKKHDAIVNDFDAQKEKHLEKLATKTLQEQEKLSRLKEKNIKTDFFKLF